MILEAILLISMGALAIVLVLEMREYRKIRRLTAQLEILITTYTAAFNSVTSVITTLETRYNRTAEEHIDINNQIVLLKSIIEIHNKALHLNPDLLEIKKNGSKSDFA